MLVYILYFIILAALAITYEYKPFPKFWMLVISCLMLGLQAGLRGPHVDRDFADYQHSFDAIDSYYREITGGRIFTFFEPGYVLIVYGLKTLAPLNYGAVCMLFFGLSSMALKTISINKISFNPFLVLLFYFSHYFLLQEMTLVRIGFASAIVFVGFTYYLKEERWTFLLFILLASIFHYSAILYLLVFAFNTHTLNKPVYLTFLGVSILMGFIKIDLFDVMNQINPELITGKLRGYEYVAKTAFRDKINTFNVVYLANAIVILYLLLVPPKEVMKQDNSLIFFIKCNILSLFLLSALNGVPAIAFRISELYGITSIFLFAGSLYYLPFKKGNILMLVALAALFTYINFFHNNLINPYTIIRFR